MAKPRIDILKTLVEYHEDVYRLYDIYKKAVGNLQSDHSDIFWNDYDHFCTNELRSHFKLEELVVFKGMMNSRLTTQLKATITRLADEHRQFLRIAAEILELRQRAGDKNSVQTLYTDLFRKLLIHARIEEATILPLLGTRADLQILIGREFLKNRHLLTLKKKTV